MATKSAVPVMHAYTSMPKIGNKFSNKLEPVVEKPSEEMSEQQLPEQLKTFTQILASVGFLSINENIFNQLRAMFPTIEADSLTNRPDLFLSNLFKCDVYHHGCYFSVENEGTFREHLCRQHSTDSLYCFYCTKTGHQESNCVEETEHTVYNGADLLIEHIKQQHSSLAYQCNLCFYRAFSADHVFIHQAIEHLSNFEETLKRVILEKKENQGALTPIEEHFLQQTGGDNGPSGDEDDETEVENSDDESDTVSSNVKIPKHSVSDLCKIIRCGPAQSPELDAVIREYFTKQAVVLDSRTQEKYANTSKVLCAYCQPEPAVSEHFIAHAVCSHNSFPILAYDMSNQRSNKSKYELSDLDELDDDEAENIVSHFRQQLAENALPRSYDDSLMQAAFAFYATLDSQASKGVKRKLNADAAESESASAEGLNEAGTQPKRRRLLERVFSEPVWQRTRRVVSVIGTAVMAVGFYHLTHLLPDSVQNYLN